MKKLKNKIGVSRLSFSVPAWMVPLLKKRAFADDMTLSQYIRLLVRNDCQTVKVWDGKSVITEYQL